MNRTLAVVHAGLRTPSTTAMLATTLGDAVASELRGRGDEVTVFPIELRGHAHAIADAMLTGFAAEELAEDIEVLHSADAVVVVSPTFSASYSGLFKSFFDVLEPGLLADKPLVLGATGGTERHSLVLDHALRPLFTYLGADPVRTGVFAATSDFGADQSAIQERARRAAVEVANRLGGRPAATPSDAELTEGSGPDGDALQVTEDFASMMARMGLGS